MSTPKEPELKVIDGVPYLSVGDTIILARRAYLMGANTERFADALATLVEQSTKPKLKPKPAPQPKKKEKPRGRTGKR